MADEHKPFVPQNVEMKEFTIGMEAVEDPERILSEWVVQSYRGTLG